MTARIWLTQNVLWVKEYAEYPETAWYSNTITAVSAIRKSKTAAHACCGLVIPANTPIPMAASMETYRGIERNALMKGRDISINTAPIKKNFLTVSP